MNTVIEKLVDETSFDLPDEFIKKLLKENSGEDPDENQLAGQFDNFSKSVRWQLIENKLSKDHGLKVEEGEMRDVVRNYFGGQLYFPPGDEEAEKRMNHIIDSVMTNKEEAGRIHDQLFEKKMLELFRSKVKIKRKAIDYDEFIKIVTQKVKPS
jgi:trigger factor